MKRKSSSSALKCNRRAASTPCTPTPETNSPISSPDFKPNSKSKSKAKPRVELPSTSFAFAENRSAPGSILELKELVSSGLIEIKRNIESSHSAIMQENEAYKYRLNKRLKIQTQACQQVMDEAEKEYKKLSDQISEKCEAITDSYKELMKDAQSSASRVCKQSIPSILQSFEKAVDDLRSRSSLQSSSKGI